MKAIIIFLSLLFFANYCHAQKSKVYHMWINEDTAPHRLLEIQKSSLDYIKFTPTYPGSLTMNADTLNVSIGEIDVLKFQKDDRGLKVALLGLAGLTAGTIIGAAADFGDNLFKDEPFPNNGWYMAGFTAAGIGIGLAITSKKKYLINRSSVEYQKYKLELLKYRVGN